MSGRCLRIAFALLACVSAVCLSAWAADSPSTIAHQSAHAPRPGRQAHGRRWEIEFVDGIATADYLAELDFFKIEIAAVAKDGKIDYLSHVSRAKPEKHAGHELSDYRWHVEWTNGDLRRTDRRLLGKAGISTTGKRGTTFPRRSKTNWRSSSAPTPIAIRTTSRHAFSRATDRRRQRLRVRRDRAGSAQADRARRAARLDFETRPRQ